MRAEEVAELEGVEDDVDEVVADRVEPYVELATVRRELVLPTLETLLVKRGCPEEESELELTCGMVEADGGDDEGDGDEAVLDSGLVLLLVVGSCFERLALVCTCACVEFPRAGASLVLVVGMAMLDEVRVFGGGGEDDGDGDGDGEG